MMGDKAQNQQQQPMNHSPWGGNNNTNNNQVWQCGPMGFYGNQGGSPFAQNMGYPNPFNYQFFNSQQQQIAFTNANNALMQNGIRNQLTGFIPQATNNAMNQGSMGDKSNVLPPLPPGPPPPLNGQKFQPPPPPAKLISNGGNNNNNNGAFYGQPQNTAYPPITFNMNNKKTGLGFQPNLNNSGAGKKKRRKNKTQMQQMNMQQFNHSFQSAGTANTYPQQPPPLPADIPPPFPPLPPLPVDPPALPPGSSNTTTTQSPDVQIISGSATLPNQSQARYKSPLLPAVIQPKNNWPGLDTSEPWPDSLKAYVNRCYSKCVEDVDKDQVEIILKGKITSAANDGSLWIKNWDLELLPSLYSERKTIEIKKPYVSPAETPKSSPVQRGPPNFTGGKRGRGLSASMGSRLGGFGQTRQQGRDRQRSRSRSFSPGKGRRRSRSRDNSRSPARRRKDRRSSDSSSSSGENFKPLATPAKKKQRGGGGPQGGRSADNVNGKAMAMSKRDKRKMKQEEKLKSHFYSEFGNVGGSGGPVNTERLQKRADRFKGTLQSDTPRAARKRPFSLGVNTSFNSFTEDTISDVDWQNFHIVGTCMDVDKQYLRQTSAPDASTIRPIEVLQKALVAVQERWKKEPDYYIACDRMKSIRLDLTLQGIRNDFTVKVYEMHARIALEKGDHQELNQCLSQLAQLYTEVSSATANRLEFAAYGLLYYVFTKDTLELTTLLSRLTEHDKTNPCVAHAIGIRTAWLTSNYHRFFKLYKEAPRMAGYAMELFLNRERLAALRVMIKAYRPSIPISLVAKELAFENVAACVDFLTPLDLVYVDPQRTKIECKLSVPLMVPK